MTLSQCHTFRAVFLAFVTTAFLAGCAGSSTSPFVGVWGETNDSTKPSLDLKTDGAVSGTDGCNRLIGSWTEADKTLTFGGFASSRMACEGVDTWLSNAVTAKIVDGKLVVFGQGGAEIGTLSAGH